MNKKNIFTKKIYSFVLFLVILVTGAVIRMKGVFENSFAYTYDVGRDLLALREIVVDYNIPFIGPTTGLPGLFYGPWWYYILTPSFILGNGNPQALTTFIVFIGLITVVLGYYFGKKLHSSVVGLVIAGLISFSPIMLGLTTQIWNPNIAPFITLLLLVFMYLVLRGGEKREKKASAWYFFFIGMLLLLAVDSEVVYGVLLSIAVVLSGVLFMRRTISPKAILGFIAGAVLILSPRLIFELKNNFLMTRAVLSAFTDTIPGGHSIPIIERVIPRAAILWDMWKNTVGAENDIFAFLLALSIISVIILGWKKTRESTRKLVKILALTIIVFYVGLVFFSHDIWPHYIVGLPILFIVIIGIGVASLHTIFSKSKAIVFIIVGIIVIANMNPARIINDFKGPLWEGDPSVYRNNLLVVDYIYQEANGKPFKYILYTPPLHDFTYRYLFQWYGQNKFGYVPDENEDSLFFVILEPDLELPERREKWLMEREGDGVIIKEDIIKGGITVQTRINK